MKHHTETTESLGKPLKKRGTKEPRSWSARIAWVVLVTGCVLLLLRVTVLTVVTIHGNGMLPNLQDGDRVLLARTTLFLERGDMVAYDPSAPKDVYAELDKQVQPIPAETAQPRAREGLRDMAVINDEDVQQKWDALTQRNSPKPGVSLRVGRIIAIPGDRLQIDAASEDEPLRINGRPLHWRPIQQNSEQHDSQVLVEETNAELNYLVLGSPGKASLWQRVFGKEKTLLLNEGEYFILADHRAEGACCDSTALGLIKLSSIHGKLWILPFHRLREWFSGWSH